MKEIKRETIGLDVLTRRVKEELSQFNVSEIVIENILKSYFNVKRQAILSGEKVKEDGVATQEATTRKVSKNFTEKNYTVKITGTMDFSLRDQIMNKLENDDNFQYIMDFNPNKL